MPRTLLSRLEALEEQATATDLQGAGVTVGALDRFGEKFLDLVDRCQGEAPGPNASRAAHIAARFWHDPAGAVDEIRQAAHAAARARMSEAEYARWCDGR